MIRARLRSLRLLGHAGLRNGNGIKVNRLRGIRHNLSEPDLRRILKGLWRRRWAAFCAHSRAPRSDREGRDLRIWWSGIDQERRRPLCLRIGLGRCRVILSTAPTRFGRNKAFPQQWLAGRLRRSIGLGCRGCWWHHRQRVHRKRRWNGRRRHKGVICRRNQAMQCLRVGFPSGQIVTRVPHPCRFFRSCRRQIWRRRDQRFKQVGTGRPPGHLGWRGMDVLSGHGSWHIGQRDRWREIKLGVFRNIWLGKRGGQLLWSHLHWRRRNQLARRCDWNRQTDGRIIAQHKDLREIGLVRRLDTLRIGRCTIRHGQRHRSQLQSIHHLPTTSVGDDPS